MEGRWWFKLLAEPQHQEAGKSVTEEGQVWEVERRERSEVPGHLVIYCSYNQGCKKGILALLGLEHVVRIA